MDKKITIPTGKRVEQKSHLDELADRIDAVTVSLNKTLSSLHDSADAALGGEPQEDCGYEQCGNGRTGGRVGSIQARLEKLEETASSLAHASRRFLPL